MVLSSAKNVNQSGTGGPSIHAGPPSGNGAPPAKKEHAAPPNRDEVGEHFHLSLRESARFDAPEDDGPIGEELTWRLRKAVGQLLSVVDVEPQVLVLCGPLERDELNVAVRSNGRANESGLVARLPFYIEDLFAALSDVDHGNVRVVLRNLLTGLNGDAKGQRTRASTVEKDADVHRGHVAVSGQRDRVLGDDLAVVFDDQRHSAIAVSALADEAVRRHRGSAHDRTWGLDPADLDVLVEPLRPDPDREHGNGARPKREQLIADRRGWVVRAVR